jgi:DNA-directed RNA polymerase I, II, and III subunit RPABC1
MDSEFSTVWRVRKTINSMLECRGFVIASEDSKMTMEEFKQRYGEAPVRDQLTILASKLDKSESIFVFWAEEEKIGVKPIKNYVTRMEKENLTRAILILKKGITTFAKRILQELAHPIDPSKPKRIVELFETEELLINITEHVFVPEHKLLSEIEKKALLEKYKLKETQLPRIQLIDPIARFYGLQKGQVVKIIRPSETAGRYVTYRLVV